MISLEFRKQLNDLFTNSKIKNLLFYEGVSLWWFHEIELCRIIDSYINNKKKKNIKKKACITIFEYIYNINKLFIRSIISKIIVSKKVESIKDNNILAISYTSYWKFYSTSNKGNIKLKQDAMLGDIINNLVYRNFNVIGVDYDTSNFLDLKSIIEKNNAKNKIWKPIEFYLTIDIIKKVLKTSKKLKKDWNKLIRDNELNIQLIYKGIDLSKHISEYLNKNLKYSIFFPIIYIELMKKAIEIEKPDLILITCSYSLLGRASIIAGKINKVPTLEIQHGVIHPLHYGYIYPKTTNFSKHNSKNIYYPIPDKTAVYGKYHNELLTENSIYSNDEIVVTGQPRYDFFYNIEKVYSKQEFVKKNKINPNNKIVLWAAVFQGIPINDDIRDIKALFSAFERMKGVTLIIKPHPWDSKVYIELIEKLKSDYNLNILLMPNNSDTFELLYICDLLITRNSTVGMEAVALGKPIVVLDLDKKRRISGLDYVEDGIALGIYSDKNIQEIISYLLTNDLDLAKNREGYIKKYLYKVDGNASYRIFKLIKSMIDENN